MTSDFVSWFEKRMNSAFGHEFMDDFVHHELVPLSHFTEKNSKWILEVDLPGVKKNNIDVTITSGHLVIKAKLEESYRVSRHGYVTEFEYFKKVIGLPPHVNTKKIETKFKNGILTITILKITAGKKISVK
jgi:HSP20 family protein